MDDGLLPSKENKEQKGVKMTRQGNDMVGMEYYEIIRGCKYNLLVYYIHSLITKLYTLSFKITNYFCVFS